MLRPSNLASSPGLAHLTKTTGWSDFESWLPENSASGARHGFGSHLMRSVLHKLPLGLHRNIARLAERHRSVDGRPIPLEVSVVIEHPKSVAEDSDF